MTTQLTRGHAIVLLAVLLAGCAAPGERPAADASHEESVYFANRDGGLEKFAATIGGTPGQRNLVVIRSGDGNRVAVCTAQAGGAQAMPSGRDPSLAMIRIAFFQNCMARANGFIDQQEFLRVHQSLIDAVSRYLSAGKPH